MDNNLQRLEAYQALTWQEGQHIDELCTALKCVFIKSKFFDQQDKAVLKQNVSNLLDQELRFCDLSDNYEASELIKVIQKSLPDTI